MRCNMFNGLFQQSHNSGQALMMIVLFYDTKTNSGSLSFSLEKMKEDTTVSISEQVDKPNLNMLPSSVDTIIAFTIVFASVNKPIVQVLTFRTTAVIKPNDHDGRSNFLV